MTRRLKILVDVDDVLVKFVESWLFYYNVLWRDTLTVKQITDWDISKFVKPECGNQIYHYVTSPMLYYAAHPVAGAYDGIRTLREKGHFIQFVTAQENTGKRWWMQFYGFLKDWGEYLVEPEKWNLDGDLLIDDNGYTLRQTIHMDVILFDRPWNQEYTLPRARSWGDVLNLVQAVSLA